MSIQEYDHPNQGHKDNPTTKTSWQLIATNLRNIPWIKSIQRAELTLQKMFEENLGENHFSQIKWFSPNKIWGKSKKKQPCVKPLHVWENKDSISLENNLISLEGSGLSICFQPWLYAENKENRAYPGI